MATDPSNFHKGLRNRAEHAEAEVKRITAQLDRSLTALIAADKKAEIPLAVLEGLVSIVAHVEAQEQDIGRMLPGAGINERQLREVRQAIRWVRERYHTETNPCNIACTEQEPKT